MRPPEVIAAADWSVRAEGRWLARASLQPGPTYRLDCVEEVGDATTLLARLRKSAGVKGTALLGFDLPIGLPRAYAGRFGVTSFRDTLRLFGSGPWNRFYELSDRPSPCQPFAPRSPKAGLGRREHASLIGCSEPELLRRCEIATAGRNRAECMFFTLGAKQVGRALIHCWRDVLAPDQEARIWPFDGPLASLLATPGLILAEVYPAESAAQLELRSSTSARWSKRNQENRMAACGRLLLRDAELSFSPSSSLRGEMEAGFDSDDAFDAVIALIAMIQVALGRRDCEPPDDPTITSVEGWILGQARVVLHDAQQPRTSAVRRRAQNRRPGRVNARETA